MSARSRSVLPSFLVGTILLITAAPSAAATAGALDPSFGGDGKVTTNFTTGDDLALAVAVQPSDGKIVAAGGAPGSGGRFAVARYSSDGNLDTSFSGDGKVTTNFTSGRDFAAGVAIQTDERIVAAGTANFNGDARFAVARYNPDGTLDTSFSGDGRVTTNLSPAFDGIYGVVIQDDGKIVVAGAAGSGGSFALARYNIDGTPDTSFSGDGMVTTSITSGYDFADDVTIDPGDDRIVAGGAANFFGGDPRFAVARYNTDGTLDTSFSGDGKVTTNFTSGDDFAFGVAIQGLTGTIVAAGRAGGSGGTFALARYLSDGTLDTTFGGDGKVTTNFTSGYDYADDVAIQTDLKIVAAGAANTFRADSTFAVARYNTDGTLDTAFSGDGKVATNFTGGLDYGVGVALQPSDGNIVTAGRAGGSGGRFALVRYLAA
jgi:uncharacterized delta-60 repeat protein